MSNWKEYKFSDFVSINPTVKLKKGELYSFVQMKDLNDGQKFCEPAIERELSGGSRFQNGDTLFARITPCLENGKICQVRNLKNDVGFGSTEFYVFRGKEGISDSEFVFYLSRWDEVRDFAEMNFDGTSGRQRVPKETFGNLYIKMPLLNEQKEIASILSSLDSKIDLLQRNSNSLEELAQTIFRQWFIEEKKFSKIELNVLANHFKKSVNPQYFPTKIFNHYSIPAFDNGQRQDIVLGKNIKSNKYLVKSNTILVSKLNPQFPRIWLIQDEPQEDNSSISSTEFQVVEPKDTKYLGYIYCFLKSKQIIGELSQATGGTSGSHQRIDPKDIFKLLIPDIDKSSLEKFNEITNPIWDKINNNKKEINSLRKFRESYLPKLMSGEIRVKM